MRRSGKAPGLTLDPKGDGFVLRRTAISGRTTTITLSIEELAGLETTIALRLSERLQSYSSTPEAQPVAASPIGAAAAHPGTLGETVVLALVTPDQHRIALSLPVHVAERLASEISSALARMPGVKLTRQ